MDMDMVQDWAMYLVGNQFGVTPYARQAYKIANMLKSWLLPFINQLVQKPDLATIALLLVIIFVSLKVLNMLYNTVMFWVRLVGRLAFWGGLSGLALWMYTRGPEGVSQDMQYWYDAWTGEYKYWKDKEQAARLMYENGGQNQRGLW